MTQCDASLFTEIVKTSINEVYIFDSQSLKFLFVNDAALLNMGYSIDEFLEMQVITIKPNYTSSEFKNYIQPLLEGSVKSLVFQTQHKRKDSSLYTVEIQLQCIVKNRQKLCIAVGRDVTDKVKSKEKLIELATIDSLTNIYNRYQINAEIESAIIRAQKTNQSFSLVMIDIDYFKKVNDTFGHDIGDQVLIEFTTVLKKNLRKNDKIGRWGGEEFIVLLTEISKENTLKVAQKMCKEIDTYTFNSIGQLTCSIGLSLFKKDDTKLALVKRIDKALYISKNRGRNRVSILE